MEKKFKNIIKIICNLKFYIFLFFYLLFFSFNLFSDQTDELLKNAIIHENNGDFDTALKFYNKYLLSNNDEKVYLRIIRLTPDYDSAVQKYNDFFKKFPASRFRFITRYELSKLHLINNKYNEALTEFIKLKEISRGNEYYYRASYNIAAINYKINEFDEALKEINYLLSDNENSYYKPNCYYLKGLIDGKKENLKESENNFLFCINNYAGSDIIASCMYELIKLYIKTNDLKKADNFADKLHESYPDSFENYAARKLLKNGNNISRETELSYLDEEEVNKDNRIKSDLKLSLDINDSNSALINKSYYIQLSYLSNYENAKILMDSYKLKGLNDIFISKTRSAGSNNIFYRLLTGPYFDVNEAKKRQQVLNTKKIDSIIMELVKSYE